MTSSVEKSHWIPRFLLRRWESEPGKLRFFDFMTERTHRISAKNFFVSPTPFPAEIEAALATVVETPIGKYVARCEKAGAGLVAPLDESEDHAIVIALMSQSLRTGHANGRMELQTLSSLLSEGVERQRQFAAASRLGFEFFGVNLHTDRLFFPSTGSVSLPTEGALGWMLPMSPRSFIACLPKYVFDAQVPRLGDGFPVVESARDGALESLRSIPGVLTAISTGIVGDKVVLPPDMPGSEDEIKAQVVAMRSQAKGLSALIHRKNHLLAATAPRGFPINDS